MDNQNQRSPNSGHPVDKGWSWAICIGGCICYFLVGVSTQALSVLNLELAEHFKVSLTVVSMILMMQVFGLSISTCISVNILVPRFGIRKVTVVAGFIFGSCSIACSHVPHIAYFIILSGIQGLAVGAVLVPVISILRYYFDEKTSLATAICGAGLCISNIVSPSLIRLLMDTFGLERTFLLLGGLELNMMAAGLLLRPLSYYSSSPRIDNTLPNVTEYVEIGDLEGSLSTVSSRTDIELTDLSNLNNHNPSTSDAANGVIVSNNSSEGASVSRRTDQPDQAAGVNITNHNPSTSDAANGVIVANNSSEGASVSSRTESDQLDQSACFKITNHNPASSGAAIDVKVASECNNDSRDAEGSPRNNIRQENSSLRRMNITLEGVELDESITEENQQETALGEENSISVQSGSCCCISFFKVFCEHWAFPVYLATSIVGSTTLYLFETFPTIAVFKGVTKVEGETIYTVCGATDLASRILTGTMSDKHILTANRIATISLICLGIVCQFNQLFTDFQTMMGMGVLIGLFVGTRTSLGPVMVKDIVGVDKMEKCYSFAFLLNTFCVGIHIFALNALADSMKSYTVVLYYVGAAMILSAAGLILVPWVTQYQKKRKNRTVQTNN